MSQNNTNTNAMALEIARLKAELDAMKAGSAKKKALKVGTSGTVVLTGYRQFPFSFFKSEILDILARAEEIKAFIVASDQSLNQGKDDKRFVEAKAAAEALWASKQRA